MPKIKSLKAGENYCFLYRTKEDADIFLSSFFRHGLDRNEKNFYFKTDHDDDLPFIGLLKEAGIDIDEARRSGKLCLKNLENDEEMAALKGCAGLSDNASPPGASICRIAINDSESLTKTGGKWLGHAFDKLGTLIHPRFLSVFMYCIDTISPEALFHILTVFPSLIIGDEIYENVLFPDVEARQGVDAVSLNAGNLLDLIKNHKRLKDMLRREGEALKASEHNYLSIFESVANLIATVDKKGIIIDCNGKIQEVLGYDKEEIIGRSVAALFHPHDFPRISETVREVIKKGASYDKQYEMVRKDGSTVVVSVNSTPLKNEKGRIAKVVSIVEDITERRRAEQALLQSEKRYRQLIDMLPDAILTLSEGRIIFANVMAYRLLGLVHPRDLVGRRMQELFDEKGASTFNQYLEKILEHAKNLEPIRLKTMSSDNTVIVIEWKGMVLDRSDGQSIMFVGKNVYPTD